VEPEGRWGPCKKGGEEDADQTKDQAGFLSPSNAGRPCLGTNGGSSGNGKRRAVTNADRRLPLPEIKIAARTRDERESAIPQKAYDDA